VSRTPRSNEGGGSYGGGSSAPAPVARTDFGPDEAPF
jgi:hypothetical protein